MSGPSTGSGTVRGLLADGADALRLHGVRGEQKALWQVGGAVVERGKRSAVAAALPGTELKRFTSPYEHL